MANNKLITEPLLGGIPLEIRRGGYLPVTPSKLDVKILQLTASPTAGDATQSHSDGGGSKSEFRSSTYSIRHRWLSLNQRIDLAFHDRFHFLLSIPFRLLCLLIGFGYAVLAVFLAIGLAVVTKGDYEQCLGGATSWLDYYFFSVEAMFAIGFGSPRYPSCSAANWWVSVMVISTSIYGGAMLGALFSKFSSSTERRWAVAFTQHLAGAIAPKVPTDEASPVCMPSEQRRDVSHSDHFRIERTTRRAQIQKSRCTPLTRLETSGQIDVVSFDSSPGMTPDLAYKTGSLLNLGPNNGEEFVISFRLLNLTKQSFFDPRLSLFFLSHEANDLRITRIPSFKTSLPLEFLEMPVTVMISSVDVDSPLRLITPQLIKEKGDNFELLAVLSFIDNQSSRNIEIRRCWRLSDVVWGVAWSDMVSREAGKYVVTVEALDDFQQS